MEDTKSRKKYKPPYNQSDMLSPKLLMNAIHWFALVVVWISTTPAGLAVGVVWFCLHSWQNHTTPPARPAGVVEIHTINLRSSMYCTYNHAPRPRSVVVWFFKKSREKKTVILSYHSPHAQVLFATSIIENHVTSHYFIVLQILYYNYKNCIKYMEFIDIQAWF